uniref:Uncharacterized protein n=1 Tax=Panagrolaimus sp. JU765 TaxID=591449 RepID=A0AC34RAL3_9BILA
MNVLNRWPIDESIGDQLIFNPNDPKYKCFCRQCHALTGVKIIAGLICVTVLMEMWHLAWYLLSGNSTKQPSYMGWMLVGSCVIVIVLQFWLISIVFSCWRYFRDKRAVGYIKGYNSYIVLRPPFFNNPDDQPQTTARVQKILRSISFDEIYTKPTRYRSHSTMVKTNNIPIERPRLSSSFYDCSNIPTIIIS